MSRRRRLSLADYEAGVRAGDRATLARAITLIESTRADDQALADALLTRLLAVSAEEREAQRYREPQRVGITGVPGAGKSSLIEGLGLRLIEEGRRVAVLAIDPSSSRSGGSILGDKTRMNELSQREEAFIRPSPTSGTLGGVARKTRETILLCEAAGYDLILVETVGVGQSETLVAEMVDFFLVLLVAGAGDRLQGIKRGILEVADLIAVNKADGENLRRAEEAAREYNSALSILRAGEDGHRTRAVTVSAKTGAGLPELWARIEERHHALVESGALRRQRREQELRWMHALVEEGLRRRFRQDPKVRALMASIEAEVRSGERSARDGAARLLAAFESSNS